MALSWTRGALKNLDAIGEQIRLDSPKRAITFMRELREKIAELEHYPALGRAGRVAGSRELVLHANCVVVYRVQHEVVVIVRLHHARRADKLADK
jgi:toxin ParE1/3/4